VTNQENPLDEEQASQAARGLLERVERQHDALLGLHGGPENGSELHEDDKDSNPYKVSHAARFAMSAAVEHLQTVGAILSGAGVLFPSAQYTFIRAAIETASTAVWGVEAEKSTNVVRAADEATGSEIHVLAAWRICSGFAHGRPWATLSMLDREVVGTPTPDDLTIKVTASMGRVVWALHGVVDVIEHGLALYVRAPVRAAEVAAAGRSRGPERGSQPAESDSTPIAIIWRSWYGPAFRRPAARRGPCADPGGSTARVGGREAEVGPPSLRRRSGGVQRRSPTIASRTRYRALA